MAYWNNLFKKGKIRWKDPDKAVIGLVPLLRKRKLKRILDLGCGAGRHVLYLCKKGFFVVGSDLSPTALALTQKWLKREKISRYCLVKHEMTKIPFPNEHFDTVISTNTIHHNELKKIKKTVSEIKRVLKVRGLVLVTLSSKKDYKFRIGKKLETDTYQSEGVIHHFFNEKGVKKLFSKFRMISIKERIELKPKTQVIHCHMLRNIKEDKVQNVYWQVLAERVK